MVIVPGTGYKIASFPVFKPVPGTIMSQILFVVTALAGWRQPAKAVTTNRSPH